MPTHVCLKAHVLVLHMEIEPLHAFKLTQQWRLLPYLAAAYAFTIFMTPFLNYFIAFNFDFIMGGQSNKQVCETTLNDIHCMGQQFCLMYPTQGY